jgi:hypothetical protein
MQQRQHYIFDNFCVELRLQFNKSITNPSNPGTLQYPQMAVKLIISGGDDLPFKMMIIQ